MTSFPDRNIASFKTIDQSSKLHIILFQAKIEEQRFYKKNVHIHEHFFYLIQINVFLINEPNLSFFYH